MHGGNRDFDTSLSCDTHAGLSVQGELAQCMKAGDLDRWIMWPAIKALPLCAFSMDVDATVELTAYTGIAAFNIGFGAKTCMRKALELRLVGDASVANQPDCDGGCSFKLRSGGFPD